MDYTPLQVSRELRRIGVDQQAMGALVARELTANVLLNWLRWLPTNLGHDAFMRRVEARADDGGLTAAMRGEVLPAADPNYVDVEADEILALARELERVAPGPTGDGGSGINFPAGRARALAVLRTLPSGAGVSVVNAALDADRDQMSNDR